MSAKKRTRDSFRRRVLQRDGYRCRCCGKPGKDRQGGDGWRKHHAAGTPLVELDAHHITDRSEMPHGGYVPENGISVCDACHFLAEQFHSTGEAAPGFSPDDLYALVGSSHADALAAAESAGEG